MKKENTTEKIKKGDYSFDIDSEYPVNSLRCHFFKVGSEAEKICGFPINKNEAYCSRRNEILYDYKVCCTKYDDGKPDKKRHCQSSLNKLGNMSDKDRLELRNSDLMKDSVVKAGKSASVAKIVAYIALAGLVISGISLYWSNKNYNQLLPLNEANVILSESSIEITQRDNCAMLNNESCDVIKPYFKNVGMATAKDVSFKVYDISIENDYVKYSTSTGPIIPMFNEYVVNEISPQESISFGVIYHPHLSNESNGNIKCDIQYVVKNILVYFIKYKDEITEKYKEKYFFFSYVTGSNEVSSLIGADYSKNVPFLEDIFEKNNEVELLKYIRNDQRLKK